MVSGLKNEKQTRFKSQLVSFLAKPGLLTSEDFSFLPCKMGRISSHRVVVIHTQSSAWHLGMAIDWPLITSILSL